MRLLELEGKRVALWGLGREGRSTLLAIRRVLPELPLTVIDESPRDAKAAAFVDSQGNVRLLCGEGSASALGDFEVVVKSPGISRYRPEVVAAEAGGTLVTSATRLWFAEHPEARVVCVTGTKGKSTTASLVAHLLAGLGVRAELRGNVGRPLLDPVDAPPEVWVIELSSYQCSDLDVDPAVAVLLNLYPEHLDWHGDLETYYRDKLRLFAGQREGVAVVNRADPESVRREEQFARPLWFNDRRGFHVAGGAVCDGDRRVLSAERLPLLGSHNVSNLCAALAAASALGFSAAAAASHASSFRGLPHRLEKIGVHGGIIWIDDSISTTPQSAMAAIEAFAGRPLTVLLGGYDRGLDYAELGRFVAGRPDLTVVVLPPSGTRIAAAIAAAGGGPEVHEAPDLDTAVEIARDETPLGGVVLLSPAAPSYGAFRNFEERGLAFARAAGFAV